MTKATAIIGLGLAAGGLLYMATRAKAAGYICPVCEEVFDTLEELQTHFTAAHPREPIPITWE